MINYKVADISNNSSYWWIYIEKITTGDWNTCVSINNAIMGKKTYDLNIKVLF